ncbi:alpha/beta fold hydrolase [Patescibacteria group bacterium]|nr:alpha/beta fold hydrolase [Patescibacteria group bacterium]
MAIEVRELNYATLSIMKWLLTLFVMVCCFSLGMATGYSLHTSPLPAPIASVIPRPLDQYTIENLSKRTYPGSRIILDQPIATESAYTTYLFHFVSDGKKVTGVATVPAAAPPPGGKYPVIVQFRGYADKTGYFSGEGTLPSGRVYAAHGFLTLAPDFLGYGGSDPPSTDAFEDRFLTYVTALNLLSSVKTLPMADPDRVAIWGHSNGGQIALTVLEILGKPVPAVLWAPVSAPFPFSILYYSDEAPDAGKKLRYELARFETLYDVNLYTLTNYLPRIKGPLEIEQGTSDDAVPVAWTDSLVEKLTRDGNRPEYYLYPGADHNLRVSDGSAWNTAVARDITFFTKTLGRND